MVQLKFIVRLVLNALGLGLAAYLLPGIYVDGLFTLVIAAILLGLVNAVIKPLLILLTLPISIITLGLFLLVINAAMLGLVAWLLPGFAIQGFFSALLGWLVITIVGWLASFFD